MKSIEKVLNCRKGFGDIRHGNMFFNKKKFIYELVNDWVCDMRTISSLSSYFVQLEKSLPLLKKSILDESLPLYVFGLKGLFSGGRVTDAIILGIFQYSESLPELLEVAQHDFNYEMRGVSAESIGKMKKDAWNLAYPLCDILLKDKSFSIKGEISKALGRIGNPFSLNFLRDSFDDARFAIKGYELKGYPYKFESSNPWERSEADSACSLLENCIISLFRIDKKSGREALSIGLNDGSNVVYHWSKRAGFWFDYYSRKS